MTIIILYMYIKMKPLQQYFQVILFILIVCSSNY